MNTEILSRSVKSLVLQAIRLSGSYEPSECLHFIDEQLTRVEYQELESFLAWCGEGAHRFGHGNIDEVYTQYLTEQPMAGEAFARLANGNPYAFAAISHEDGRSGIALAIQDAPGYIPIPAMVYHALAFDDAERYAERLNLRNGIPSSEAARIILSSMRAQNLRAQSQP